MLEQTLNLKFKNNNHDDFHPQLIDTPSYDRVYKAEQDMD